MTTFSVEAIQNFNASFLSCTCNCQNGPDSLKFCHLPLASMMLFGLSNKLILFAYHYQTPCRCQKKHLDFRVTVFDIGMMHINIENNKLRESVQPKLPFMFLRFSLYLHRIHGSFLHIYPDIPTLHVVRKGGI